MRSSIQTLVGNVGMNRHRQLVRFKLMNTAGSWQLLAFRGSVFRYPNGKCMLRILVTRPALCNARGNGDSAICRRSQSAATA